MALSLRDVETFKDEELFSALPSWNYREYARQYSRCYDNRQVSETAVDGDSITIYDCEGLWRDKCIGAHARRWRAMSWWCPGVFLNMPNLDMSFARHSTDVENVRRMHEIFYTDISSDSDFVDFSYCRLPRPFSSFYLIQKINTWS